MDAVNLDNAMMPPSPGDLVVQTGRHAGTRRPLGNPATFVGSGADCDIRLNVKGVKPLHCLLVVGPAGILLRDLHSGQGTLVNGDRADDVLLQNNDVIKVGSFEFRLELHPAKTPTDEARDALRVQVASVAAQQIALEEEEAKLERRRLDLERQEEQLAAHLAEKQRQVELWAEQNAAERESLRSESLAHQERLDKADEEILKAQQQLSVDRHKLEKERQKINRVYQRLRLRWKEQWAAEKAKYNALREKLQSEATDFAEREKVLSAKEVAHAENVLRFNGERELVTRQLGDERTTLAEDQERWRKRRSHEMAVLHGMRQRNDEVQLNLKKAQKLLAEEKARWDSQLDSLQKELYGLNTRAIHQREKIEQQRIEIARLDQLLQERNATWTGTLTVPSSPVDEGQVTDAEATLEGIAPVAPHGRDEPATQALDALASELADQRLQLVDQYERLATIHDEWLRQRRLAAADLDALAQKVTTQEHALAAREQSATERESAIAGREQEVAALQEELLVWRAQLQLREQAFVADCERETANLHEKESLLNAQLEALTKLRLRWNQRRQQELDEIAVQRAVVGEELQRIRHQRLALFEATQQLEVEKRTLAANTLALERYRQEVFFRANDPSAKRRVERLRRRWLSLNAGILRDAKAEREAAKSELADIEGKRIALNDLTMQLRATEAALADRERMIEERDLALRAKLDAADQELASLERERQKVEELAHRGQEELDLVAAVVLAHGGAAPLDRAA